MSEEFKKQAEETLEVVLQFRISNSNERMLERLVFYGAGSGSMSRVTSTRPATDEEGRLWNLIVNTEAAYRAKMHELGLVVDKNEKLIWELSDSREMERLAKEAAQEDRDKLNWATDQMNVAQEKARKLQDELALADEALTEANRKLIQIKQAGVDAYEARDSLDRPKG
jgi:hypothetical protein